MLRGTAQLIEECSRDNQDFYYFATEAMRFPHYIPCDFTTNKKESDGSIDTLDNNLKTVDVKNHSLFILYILCLRKINMYWFNFG